MVYSWQVWLFVLSWQPACAKQIVELWQPVFPPDMHPHCQGLEVFAVSYQAVNYLTAPLALHRSAALSSTLRWCRGCLPANRHYSGRRGWHLSAAYVWCLSVCCSILAVDINSCPCFIAGFILHKLSAFLLQLKAFPFLCIWLLTIAQHCLNVFSVAASWNFVIANKWIIFIYVARAIQHLLHHLAITWCSFVFVGVGAL